MKQKTDQAQLDEDIVKLYLDEIRDIPLLSQQEELELAKRSAAGDQKAKARMTEANLRLVHSIANRYRGVSQLELLDLIQYGNIGLMKAVDDFDWKRGNRFSTFATRCIRQAIVGAIAEHGGAIKLPENVLRAKLSIKAFQEQYLKENQRKPTEAEIARALKLSEEKVRDVLVLTELTESLNQALGEDKDSATLGDTIADTRPSEALRKKHAEALEQVLQGLYEREQQVLMLRYGMEDGKEYTEKEIAERLGITKARVDLIIRKAKGKMRRKSSLEAKKEILE